MDHLGMTAQESTAIVQGFGNVGSVAAASLAQRGVRIVGISDRSAAFYDPAGIDVAAPPPMSRSTASWTDLARRRSIRPSFWSRPCDILVPAALERTITVDNVDSLKCRILAEGANGPTTPEADAILDAHRDDVFVIPDICAIPAA
jgi:glutamate dehydrogenase (NAD(P)+)